MAPPETFPAVLLAAREAWGLRRDELAALAEIELAELDAAERGEADTSVLASLVEALGGRLDDLLAERRFWEAPAVAFKSAPQDVDRGAVRAGLLRLSLVAKDHRDVEQLLGVSRPPPTTLAPLALTSPPAQQAVSLAGRVREVLGAGIEPIASVREVLERLGFPTFLTSLGTSDVDGLSWRDPDGRGYAAANVDARQGHLTAMRMTFAHELCHLLFDGTAGQPFGAVDRRDDERHEGLEQRANAFGAHFLAPRAAVADLLRRRGLDPARKPTAQHLLAVSETFGLGVEATAWHFVSCRLWTREDVSAHEHLRTRTRSGEDTRELAPTDAERIVPLERRGTLLDLSLAAVEAGLISAARWRELAGVSGLDDWRALWAEREVEADAEHRAPLWLARSGAPMFCRQP